jgi:hypothetical protein
MAPARRIWYASESLGAAAAELPLARLVRNARSAPQGSHTEERFFVKMSQPYSEISGPVAVSRVCSGGRRAGSVSYACRQRPANAEMKPGVAVRWPKIAKPFSEAELAKELARIVAKELARIVPKIRKSRRVLKFRTGSTPAV